MERNEYAIMYELENDYWWYKAIHELVKYYVKKEASHKDLRIFDAGCGTGRMMEILNKYGQVEGLDYSKNAINFSKKRGLENVKVEDLNNWGSNGKLYDVIICLDVIGHSAIKNDMQILNKFYKSLNNNGILIIHIPAFQILKRAHDLVVFSKRRYRKNTTIKELKNIGFNVIKATYRLPYLFLFLVMKKYFEKLIYSTNKIQSDLQPLPLRVNKLLLSINRIENKLITSGINMPFGSSLFIIAKKNQ